MDAEETQEIRELFDCAERESAIRGVSTLRWKKLSIFRTALSEDERELSQSDRSLV